MRALRPGARMVFISVWPVLKSLPQTGTRLLRGQLAQGRHVERQVGGAVGEGDAERQGGVGVDHARRDLVVVRRRARLEGGERSRGPPRASMWISVEPHQTITERSTPRSRWKAAISSIELAGELPLAPLLDVGAVEALDVAGIEHPLHRPDRLQLRARSWSSRLALEDAGLAGGRVGVVGEDVPGAEDEVVQLRQRDEVLQARHPVLGPLAEADRAHLGERADRLAEPLLDRLDAGDEGGRDRPQPHQQHPQLPLRRLDVNAFLTHGELLRRRASSSRATHVP